MSTNVAEVRSFLGLARYYARFIPQYAHLATPLSDLLGKEQTFIWGTEQQEAFQTLKNQLIKSSVLKHSHLNQPFVVYTDVSDQGLGAALHQVTEDGKEYPVYFESHKL